MSTKQKGWIGFDLDGTLAIHDPDNFDPLVLGKPIERMVAKAKQYIADGYEVRIVTARVSHHPDEITDDRNAVRKAIEDWTEKHLGERCKVTNSKDYHMLMLYDDRCCQVIPNTGVTMGELVGALRRMLEQLEANVVFDNPEVDSYLEQADRLGKE